MADGKKSKILIVDDNDAVRETYVQVFKQKGFDVISGVDGVEGVDLATKEIPDVILTGIIMPRMDGFQLIKTLQENVQTRDIPIAVLSHLGREEDRKKTQELGINEFIVQGTITINEIVGKIRSLLKSGESYKLSFDPYAWDAPRLAKNLEAGTFECPSCREKVVLEVKPKAEKKGYDAILKCPKCDFVL
ncbi:MAG: response regulator [Patescibacteria group bacterium]|nr:response regulator [Patescibacteria group bacterium]